MSNVVLNHIDQDLIEYEVTQHGQNYSEVMLKDELLDGKKSYHFAVNSLSVPMRNAPIHPVTEDTTLFTIRRRVQGIAPGSWASFVAIITPGDDAAALATFSGPGNAALYSVYFNVVAGVDNAATILNILQFVADRLGINNAQAALALMTAIRASVLLTGVVAEFKISPNRPQYSVAEFVQELQQTIVAFNQKITREGIAAVRHNLGVAYESPAVNNVNVGNLVDWLMCRSNCDSALMFQPGSRTIAVGQQHAGDKFFSNYFYLDFSPYGAGLMGIPIVDLFQRTNESYLMIATGNSYTAAYIG